MLKSTTEGSSRMHIDHVVRVVPDLDEAAARVLANSGLASVAGGHHPGWGTANRVIPLGNDYLELLSVVDRTTAERSDFGRAMLRHVAAGEHWFVVCLADEQLDATAARLGLEISAGSRVRPNGTEVRWRSAGLDDPKRDPSLPFFIEWDVPPELHPGRATAAHRTTPTGVAWVEVAGDPARLAGWLGGVDVPLRVVEGEPRVRAVAVATADGTELVLT
jgi:hypothetical protein